MKSNKGLFLSTRLLIALFVVFAFFIPFSLHCLAANGAVSGRVTDESATGLANVKVKAYIVGQTYALSWSYTDGDGYYAIPDLPPGSYKILFTGEDPGAPEGYIWEYYNDKHSYSEASAVAVTSGATTPDINAVIAPIPADPYEPNEDMSSAYTVTSGTYGNIHGDVEGGDMDWFKIYLNEGQDLRVAVSSAIPIFPDPASPLDIDLFLYDAAGNCLAEAVSSRDIETLYLSNASAGWYYVSIQYAPPSVLSLSFTAGDLVLGEVTGHITNGVGEGVKYAKVGFFAWNNLDWSLFNAYALTDASGNYKFAFTPGNYRIRIDTDEAQDPYVLGEWYDNQSSGINSAIISIKAGQTTSGINAQLADGAAISGQVTDQDSNPIAMATARAYDAQGNSVYVYTDDGGNYLLGHIPVGDGTRKMRFRAGGYGMEWWDGKSSFGVADSVSIQARQTTAGIDAKLPKAGRITGRVADSMDNGIPNVTVTVYDSIQNLVGVIATTTDENGNYSVGSLPTMDAKIFFDAGKSGSHNSEFYSDKLTFAEAGTVSVTSGSATSNINAQLSTRSITIREPDGGEAWCAGSSRRLQWDNAGTISNVKIEYSFDNGRTFTTVIASTPNTGSYDWVVPAVNSSSCFIRISDASNPGDYDDSNAAITISAGQCRVPADFNKDGYSDGTVWRPSSGTWYVMTDYDSHSFFAIQWGISSDIPVAGDYDGDAQADIAVWRPSTGRWYVQPSASQGTFTNTQWGTASDIPVPGDYNGDGKIDIAVFRPGTGTWYILSSGGSGSYTTTKWGVSTDIPVPADYDGDGKTDIAVWRPSTGTWYIMQSSIQGSYISKSWGTASDIPVPADYDADFKADVAVWRPSTGTWYLMLSTSLSGVYTSTRWGVQGDKLAVDDFDNDGKMDIAVWRPGNGTWYVLPSTNPGQYVSAKWGTLNDVPITLQTRILSMFP